MSRFSLRLGKGIRMHAAAAVTLGLGGMAAALIVGCGGASRADVRSEGAVTKPESYATRTPARQAPSPASSRETDASPDAARLSMAPSSADSQAQAVQPGGGVPGPAAAVPSRVDRQAWRPSWWITSPVREGGQIRVAAMADAADVLEARRKAVGMGLSDLRSYVGAEADEFVEADTSSIDVISLPDGRYRAFVLVEAPM